MLVETKKCGRLYVDVRGPDGAPTIVLWHSVLCDGSMWADIPERLAGRYRVINVDGPGHGRSSVPSAPYTMDDCVDAALDVLDACGVQRAIWCGLSWGGMVGMRVAARHGERLSSLVLIDSNADKEVPQKLPSYHALALIQRTLGTSPWLLDRIQKIFFSEHTLRSNPAVVQAFRRGVAAMSPDAIRLVLGAVIFGREDFRGALGLVRVPTLILVGGDDVATPRARAEALAKGIGGSRLVEIARAGHLSAWEQPDAVLAEIERFLRDQQPAAQPATA